MTTSNPSLAEEWIERAKARYAEVGKEIALADFNNPRGAFLRAQHYLWVLDLEGNMLAHGINYYYVGLNFMHIVDSTGKKFVKEIVDTAKSKTKGWIDYTWMDPVSKKTRNKNAYFERVADMIICCGTYRETQDPSEPELIWDGVV
jgi:hypothetical protein